MIKEIQYHPVTDEIIHVDLMRVRRSEKMTILVPLVLVGSSIGVKEGGILSQSINQVEISCLPTNVPENIEINIENIEQGQSLSVGDIDLKDKEVELVTASDINILTIQAPGGAEEEVEEAELYRAVGVGDIEGTDFGRRWKWRGWSVDENVS